MDDAGRVRRALPRLPIFPLPGAVLLPHSLVPLHVFEPRYRKMTRDCAEGARVMALANVPDAAAMAERAPAVLPVVGVGVLARVEPLQDGRFNIVLRGVLRARILREHETAEPYRLVEAVPLETREAAGAALHAAVRTLREYVLALARADASAELAALSQLAAHASQPGDLADVVASVLLDAPPERQAVLEAQDLAARLELATQAAARRLAQTASSTAAPN